MAFSFWEREAFLRHVDYAVIGAGLVGLNAALTLREKHPQAQIVVLEQHPLNGGGSSRNAGFACFGSPSELLDDLQTLTEDEVLSLVERRWKGLQALRQLLGDEAIGFEPVGGYELFSSSEEELYQQCMEALPHFNKLLSEIVGPACYRTADEVLHEQGLRGMEHALFTSYEGAIHTGKMYRSLRRLVVESGIDLLTGLRVHDWEEHDGHVHVRGSDWSMKTNQLLVCNNGFASNLLSTLDVKPARNLVMVSDPIPNLRLHGTFHMERGYIYFRSIGDRLLIGGARHLDEHWEEIPMAPVPSHIHDTLLELAQHQIVPYHPITIDCEWTGYLGIGEVKKPIVQKLSERVACGVRMGGMGVAIGTLLGHEVAALVD